MEKRKFEIPYNFDKRLINILYNLSVDGKEILQSASGQSHFFEIFCFYVPPYYWDCKANVRDGPYQDYMSFMTKEQYESHLNNINLYFPGSIQLLINDKELMSEEMIMEYHNKYDINMFCVNKDEQARIIRNCLPKANITASITMRLNIQEIESLDSSLYNNIVLFFPFNKNLKAISNLPQNFNYIIIPNSQCNQKCDGIRHWRAFDTLRDLGIDCPNKTDKDITHKIFIRPMDLKYFDKYIYAYKLQDRSWSSYDIVSYLLMATGDNFYEIMPGIDGIDPYKYYSGGDVNAKFNN